MIFKSPITKVLIQRICVTRKISLYDIQQSITVVVANRDSHSRLRLPVGRADDGSIVARQPTTDNSATFTTSVASNSNFPNVGPPRGLWAGTLNGVNYVVGAWFCGTSGTNANGVGIYSSTDGIAYTEASATSGAFGNTRMTDTGQPFAFQVSNNPVDGLDYLVIQNGTDAPRVFSSTAVNGAKVRVLKQYSFPAWAEQTKPLGVCSMGVLSTVSAVTASGTGVTAAIVGSFPQQQVTITVGEASNASPIASGATVVFDFGAGNLTGVFGRPQLLFVSDQASANLWNQWKVEVSNSSSFATTYVLADPSQANYNAPVRVGFTNSAFQNTSASGGLNGEELAAFLTTTVGAGLNGASALRYLRLTWVGPAPIGSSTLTTTIHGIGNSGGELAFNQTFTVSYSGISGMSETAGVVMAGPQSLTNAFVPSLPAVYVPYVSGVYYDYFLPIQAPSLTDLQNGCDTLNVYRQDLGASDSFFFVSQTVGYYYSGAWSYSNSGAVTTPGANAYVGIYYSTYQFTALNVARAAPSAYATVMSIGTALAFGSTRFFVGGKAFYAVSESQQPFRFVSAVDPTLSRSGTTIAIAGETINSFAVTSSGSLSANTVFMLSNVKTRMLAGFDGYSLSQPQADFDLGNEAPHSISAYKDAIFWLDDVGQIRRFSFGRAALYGYSGGAAYDLAPAISKRVVSDRTTAIPSASLPWVTGLTTFDRYYLFYTPSGGTTNTRALVFDETIGVFVEDTFSFGVQGACVAKVNGTQILLQGSDGHIYVHENANSTAAHFVNLVTREISDGMWNPLFFGRIGVVIDAQSGQSMSLTKTLKPTGATDSSTIDLHTLPVNASAAPQMWRWDSRATSTQPGLSGVASIASLSLTMTPGTRIYAITQEVQKAIAGADQT